MKSLKIFYVLASLVLVAMVIVGCELFEHAPITAPTGPELASDTFLNYGTSAAVSNDSYTVKIIGSSFKVGIGIRPYLTAPEASTQIFLFGNATYNWLREKGEFNSATSTVTDPFGGTQDITLTRSDLSVFDFDEKDNKFGVGLGAGIEIPASSSINLIFQGLYNIIFTKDSDIEGSKNLSFVGVTAGIVF